ncbi:MAG: TetR/AcrR family transcriptional regulator [Micromonosporaceae bacterium]
MVAVKRNSARAEKTRQTRLRMLRAAEELFVERGYGATPLQDIADRAGVAVQTLYFAFGNKRTLLKEVVDTAVAGDDEPVATMQRPWFREALAATTAETLLRRHVAGVRKILERVAPITEVLRVAAATDPDISYLGAGDSDPRYLVQSAVADALLTKPDADTDLTAAEAADTLYGLLSPEIYLTLVRDRGWPPERWERWTGDLLRGQLCRA